MSTKPSARVPDAHASLPEAPREALLEHGDRLRRLARGVVLDVRCWLK
ncbi:MAG: hypothetical protein AAGB93_17405 [Planctomycetota bacterium]